MQIRIKAKIFGLFFLTLLMLFSENVFAEAKYEDWNFLSTSTIGARQFIQSHPEYDGRGIVIFICDTGVDMAVPGLTHTSTGQVKVIDVRDFSGQGDVSLYAGKLGEAEQEKYIEHPDGFKLYNYQRLGDKPIENTYMIGYLDEKRFINSDIPDINNNGRFDDLVGILTFEVKEGDSSRWVAYVDTDGDHQIDDEKGMTDYRVHHDTFQLRGGDKNFDRQLLTFALNIEPDEMKVSLHFDDSGHGTHVAGIAAGYRIHDQDGFNGIAPGAQIISLKIGNGTFENGCTVTGSMRKALDFAEDYARAHKNPVVINLSYGIGSIREGKSDIDRIVHDLLTYNENIFISVSNGNDGPGISTTGTPAAASLAFSVGALLPANFANEYPGANLDADKIFYFSARGGELNKPDAVAPASASSTVPPFTDADLMRGTSMAAPQAAGAAALLLSAARQSTPLLLTKNLLIHKALKLSAKPIAGYNYLDQGNGVIDVPAAFKFLKSYSQNYRNEKVIDYEISTECPSASGGFSASAYWRTGGYFPTADERQSFSVRPVFDDSVDADSRANFYRAFELQSSHPWLIPKSRSTYIKGENPATIEVDYNPALMTQPGIYCGKITGFRKGKGMPQFDPTAIEFELINTIIIPFVFDQINKYQQDFLRRAIKPGNVDRYFIQVPTGATATKIKITPTTNNFCSVDCFIYNPEGRSYLSPRTITSKQQNTETQVISQPDLTPGIWEIDIHADFQNEKESTYDLSVNFNSFQVEPSLIADFKYQLGEEPQGYFQVTNQFNIPFYGFGRGKLLGYQRTQKKIITDRDKFSYDFSVEPDIKMVEFDIDFDDESFLKFTDVAISIIDPRGKAVLKEALNQDNGRFTLDRISSDNYMLEIVVAFAYSSTDEIWKFNLTEKYIIKDPIDIRIYQENNRLFKFFPFISSKLEFTLDKSPRIPPEGCHLFGSIEFIDRHLLQQVFSVPIEFKK